MLPAHAELIETEPHFLYMGVVPLKASIKCQYNFCLFKGWQYISYLHIINLENRHNFSFNVPDLWGFCWYCGKVTVWGLEVCPAGLAQQNNAPNPNCLFCLWKVKNNDMHMLLIFQIISDLTVKLIHSESDSPLRADDNFQSGDSLSSLADWRSTKQKGL